MKCFSMMDTYKSDKVLMKCDRCGCEMELDGYILSEIAEADGDDELSCICMKCEKEQCTRSRNDISGYVFACRKIE